MNSAQIKYFLTLCEEMNFCRASEKLNITQQGLSKSIQALEEELQVPLFKRYAHQLKLTEYGEYAYNRLGFVLDNIEKTKYDLAEMQRYNKRIISIAILEGYVKDNAFSIDSLLGPPPPNMQIIPYYCSYEQGINMLESELVDFFITKGPVSEEKLSVIATVYEHFSAVIPISDPLSASKEIFISDLSTRRVIIFNEKYKFYNNFIKKCQNNGFRPDILNTANEISSIFLPCICNKGIGIVPTHAIQNEFKNIPQISIIPFNREMDEEMCFTVLKKSRLPRVTSDFIHTWVADANKKS